MEHPADAAGLGSHFEGGQPATRRRWTGTTTIHLICTPAGHIAEFENERIEELKTGGGGPRLHGTHHKLDCRPLRGVQAAAVHPRQAALVPDRRRGAHGPRDSTENENQNRSHHGLGGPASLRPRVADRRTMIAHTKHTSRRATSSWSSERHLRPVAGGLIRPRPGSGIEWSTADRPLGFSRSTNVFAGRAPPSDSTPGAWKTGIAWSSRNVLPVDVMLYCRVERTATSSSLVIGGEADPGEGLPGSFAWSRTCGEQKPSTATKASMGESDGWPRGYEVMPQPGGADSGPSRRRGRRHRGSYYLGPPSLSRPAMLWGAARRPGFGIGDSSGRPRPVVPGNQLVKRRSNVASAMALPAARRPRPAFAGEDAFIATVHLCHRAYSGRDELAPTSSTA